MKTTYRIQSTPLVYSPGFSMRVNNAWEVFDKMIRQLKDKKSKHKKFRLKP